MYEFTALTPGDYSIRFVAPTSLVFSPQNVGSGDATDSDANPATGAIGVTTTLEPGENDPTWDAGLYLASSIGDTVWLDANRDGIQDANEPGVADVAVQLFQAGGATPIATTTTDANGNYGLRTSYRETTRLRCSLRMGPR